MAFIGIVIVGLFGALFTRLWYLQVLETEQFAAAAESNQVRIIITPPTRGRILDRHGVVLADNVRTGVVTYDHSRYSEQHTEAVLTELADLLDVPAARLSQGFADQRTHPLAPKVVATGLDEDGLLRVAERSIAGVEARWDWVRVYPQNEVGAHIVGYVGAMSERQHRELIDDGYLPYERVGRAGIEGLFEAELHGEPGRTKLEVDRQDRVQRILADVPPEPGHDIVLSIDVELQAAAESYLRQGLISARKTVSEDSGFFYPALTGAAVVMDVRNGDVLAMVSHPTYDPTWMVEGLSLAEYRSVFENPYAPGALNNLAVQGTYSPGSVFKPVTALAGLDAGLISPRAAFHDVGYYRIPDARGCTGRCTFFNADRAALGTLDLSGALTRSSDAYFYKVSDDLFWIDGPEQWAIQDMARSLGFGSPTGVQLPFEKSGRVPDGDVKQTLFELSPEAYNPYDEPARWFPGDNINTVATFEVVSVMAVVSTQTATTSTQPGNPPRAPSHAPSQAANPLSVIPAASANPPPSKKTMPQGVPRAACRQSSSRLASPDLPEGSMKSKIAIVMATVESCTELGTGNSCDQPGRKNPPRSIGARRIHSSPVEAATIVTRFSGTDIAPRAARSSRMTLWLLEKRTADKGIAVPKRHR